MASYRVQVWSADESDFSPDELVAEFENPKNLGFGAYINDIGEAFFTIAQRDVKVDIREHEGKAHVYIIREDGTNKDVVWRGTLAEHDANDIDVIFYAYGYEHHFYHLVSQWKKKWKSVQIAGATGRPVNDLWIRARDSDQSPLQWVTTGTLQSPWTTDAQDTTITLNKYTVSWKPILTALKELVAIATSDTENVVFMEIDFPRSPTDHSATFNFWRDNSAEATDIKLRYPGNVLDWSDRFVPVLLRNQTVAVGSGPKGQLYRYQRTIHGGTYGADTFGRHVQNLYLSWVRDRAELIRVTKRRTRLALREDTNVWVRCLPDSIVPCRATTSSHEIGDQVFVEIEFGVTQIAKYLLLVGEQVVFANGREYVQPMLEDRGYTE